MDVPSAIKPNGTASAFLTTEGVPGLRMAERVFWRMFVYCKIRQGVVFFFSGGKRISPEISCGRRRQTLGTEKHMGLDQPLLNIWAFLVTIHFAGNESSNMVFWIS